MLAIPRKFTPVVIKDVVKPNEPGVYALGHDDNGFKIGYVGRSDQCLQSRLATHNHLYQFDYFIFKYASSIYEAYYYECQFWHACNDTEIANIIHPASPSNSALSCPYCNFAKNMSKLFVI